MKTRSQLSRAIFAITAVCSSANITLAQASEDTEFALEEVVVTARKRAESVQDISESVVAFSESDIENAGITGVKDVVDLTPNIVLQPSYRLGVVNLSARGHATPQQGDSPVVLNFDGVQAPAQDFINQDLFDIERIEVLKGPQGALYGAGAIAGAINIVTKRPGEELGGFVKLKVGNENAKRVVAGISGPLVEDKVYFNLAGVYQDRDGYIENSLTGDNVDFLEETVIRGGLYADLDQLSIDFKFTQTDTEAGASYYESFALIADPVPQIDSLFGGPLGRFGSDISDPDYKNHSNVQTEEERELTTASLKVEYEIGEGIFTSVTGYNDSTQEDWGDLDFQPADILLQDVRFDVEVFNQEFRFASDPSGSFSWVGGVFYQKREIYNQVVVLLGDFTTGHKSIDESKSNPANTILTDGKDTIDSEAWGVFFSNSYDINDSLVLTTAVRYDRIEMDTEYVGSVVPTDPVQLSNVKASETFDKWQPKLNLAYNITNDVMIYADVARGFRTGVPNPFTAYQGGLPRFIEPEVADTIELGVKSMLLDNRVSLNAAIFKTDIENRHHYFFGASLQSMTTYDEAEVSGLEIDAVMLLSEGLKLGVAYGLMSAEIASDEISIYNDFTTNLPAVTVNNEGNTLPDTPTETFNASLTYEAPLVSDIDLFARVGYKHVSKLYFDTENNISTDGSQQYVDVRLGLKAESWDVVGFVNNATDERSFSNYAYSGGQGNYLPNTPRTYGVEATYRF